MSDELFGKHKQTILNEKLWISWSPISELIVEVNVTIPCPGFKNIFEKVTDWELPLVTLLLSGTDCAVILTPLLELEIVKVPKIRPVEISWDWIIAWLDEIIEVTIKIVLKLAPAAAITAEPTVSPIFILDIANDPASETNNEVDISGSLGSWLTLIVKSVKLSQFVFDKETVTWGEKGIHAELPVLPPTQFPQLSIKAPPPKSPLQSVQAMNSVDCIVSTSPSSAFLLILLKVVCYTIGAF